MTPRAYIRDFFHRFLKPDAIRGWTAIWRESGFSGLVRTKGWRVLAALFLFYLVRDSFLYLLLPWLIARGLVGS